MGLLESLKAKLGPAKEKVGNLALQHEGKIGQNLDKMAQAVDSKTKGKYHGHIETGTSKAKDALGKIAHKDAPGGTTPPAAS
ncbi:antitoxin [Streptomyces sp. NPDC097981]|uniref:antitoxin n=1 Tax=Streptomyces sp. NPDC097981 TaxID=3155428 RepID=UPI0033309FA7